MKTKSQYSKINRNSRKIGKARGNEFRRAFPELKKVLGSRTFDNIARFIDTSAYTDSFVFQWMLEAKGTTLTLDSGEWAELAKCEEIIRKSVSK